MLVSLFTAVAGLMHTEGYAISLTAESSGITIVSPSAWTNVQPFEVTEFSVHGVDNIYLDILTTGLGELALEDAFLSIRRREASGNGSLFVDNLALSWDKEDPLELGVAANNTGLDATGVATNFSALISLRGQVETVLVDGDGSIIYESATDLGADGITVECSGSGALSLSITPRESNLGVSLPLIGDGIMPIETSGMLFESASSPGKSLLRKATMDYPEIEIAKVDIKRPIRLRLKEARGYLTSLEIKNHTLAFEWIGVVESSTTILGNNTTNRGPTYLEAVFRSPSRMLAVIIPLYVIVFSMVLLSGKRIETVAETLAGIS